MFYDTFIRLCDEKGIKPTNLIEELGFSSGNMSRWKNGLEPGRKSLLKIAEYFNVSTDYLLGKETETVTLSPKQQKVLDLYNSLSPEQQASFEQLLDNLLGLKK